MVSDEDIRRAEERRKKKKNGSPVINGGSAAAGNNSTTRTTVTNGGEHSGGFSTMEAELAQLEKMRAGYKEELEARSKPISETWKSFFANEENRKFVTPTNIPALLWLIIGVLVAGSLVIVILTNDPVWEPRAWTILVSITILLLFGLKNLDAPDQAIVECFGSPWTIWGAGPHILIPGAMKMRPPMAIGSSIPLDTFVDEKDDEDKIPLQDDSITGLKTQFRFIVYDILKATYLLSVSRDYISQRKKEGADYGRMTIKYALEDIFDNAVRATLGGRRYDDVIAAKTNLFVAITGIKGEGVKAMKSVLEKMIEYRADMDVARFGINVEGITTSGIKSSKETEDARRAVQIEAMATRKEVETAKRETQKIETRKAVREQDFVDGDGLGGKEERILKGMIRSGIRPADAANIRNTQLLADALAKAKNPIITLSTGSGNSSDVTRGVGFGVGASRTRQSGSEESEDENAAKEKKKKGEKQ